MSLSGLNWTVMIRLLFIIRQAIITGSVRCDTQFSDGPMGEASEASLKIRVPPV